jgi:hypothetical protein
MRFYTTDWNAKRHAKRLKKVLRRYGHDVSYTSCLDLMARLYGFANFAEMKRVAADQPLSLVHSTMMSTTAFWKFVSNTRYA